MSVHGEEQTVLVPPQTYAGIADKVADIALKRPTRMSWFIAVAIAFSLTMVLAYSVGYLFWKGIGIWGVNVPVAWGFAIANYVFWVGMAMGGTFISAALLVTRQNWRTSINRICETLTMMALLNAGMYPILHLGSPWVFFYLFPYPNRMALWPQFRSPLAWDVFAVTVYLLASLAFWYLGMIPDLAMLRDRASGRLAQTVYGLLAMGWRGASRHWRRYQTATLLCAGLIIPLVLSVHSVVAADFAVTLLPWWHETVFPPYFVGGAIFSGFAMALILLIPMRTIYGLHEYITLRHIDNCGKLMLVTSLVVTYGYASECWMSWYGGSGVEWYKLWSYAAGPYAWSFWTAIFCNTFIPQLLWFTRIRRNVAAMFLIAIFAQLGMWVERFMVVIPPLSRGDYMPSAFGFYEPTIFDWSTLIGTMGFFLLGIFLFLRFMPITSSHELMELAHSTEGGRHKPREFSPKYAE